MDSRSSTTIATAMTRGLVVSKWLCVLGALIPCMAVAGWIFGMPQLTRVHPALPSMPPMTAICLALSAVAVFLTIDCGTSPIKRSIASLIGVGVSAIGIAVLSEYAFNWDFGLDGVFMDTAIAAGR